MRRLAIGLLTFALLALFLFPVTLKVADIMRWSNFLLPFIGFFRETYFTLVPGLLLLGLGLFFHDRLSGSGKKGMVLLDYLWLALFVLSSAIFFLAYSAAPDSTIRSVRSIIPTVGILAPSLQIFLVWHGLIGILISLVFLFSAAGRLGFDRTAAGSLIISIAFAAIFAVSIQRLPLIQQVEENFTDYLFVWLRNPGTRIDPQSGERYCQPPYDESGIQQSSLAATPPGIRDDIEIIGISNRTIEEVEGNWPLNWGIYSDLVDTFANVEGSVLLFDISFLDERGVFGGNLCGVLFDCQPIGGQPLVTQTDRFAQSLRNARSTIITDYPVETTDESRAAIRNYEERLEKLVEQSGLVNITNGRYLQVWARMPLPPIRQIADEMDGVGFANVLKNARGMNRWMPLVIRIPDRELIGTPGYNPDTDDVFLAGIDLIIAAEYYGVDLKRDIEIDPLRGFIRINNIPESYRERFNFDTFEMQQLDVMARPNADRSMVIPINELGLMNINFRGGRYCFRFNEILETARMRPDQAEQNFKNKIALTAMYYATGVGTARDIHLSPYGDMSGIEHHAYAINTLLNQDFLNDAPPWVNLLILLAIAVIMGLYQPRVPTFLNYGLTVVIMVVFSTVTMFVTFNMYSLLHVFPTVIIMQFVIMVAFIGLRVLTEEENVKFIRSTFSKFVSQDVVDELLTNPESIALGGAKKEVTVFFSDVRGFTTISEALGPEELVKLLNDYLSEMTELIIDYRGTIDKYMGDAIMAFWGAPVKNDDHAYYCCVAAIAQYRALQKLQKGWSEQGNIPVLDIGIGMNSGFAVVGNMGSSRRMDYTLMGDTVNLGARLETITKTYGVKICISEYTYERVKDRVYVRELDLVRVKGKVEPVRIYELMGLKDDSDLEKLKVSKAK